MWPLLVATVMIGLTSSDTSGVLGWSAFVYQQRGSLRLSLADFVVGLCVVVAIAVSPRSTRARDVRSTNARAYLALISLALLLAILQGVILGREAHAGGFFVEAKTSLYLVAVPWLAVKCIRAPRDIRILEYLILLLASAQAAVGILNVTLGAGPSVAGSVLAAYTGGPLLVVLLGVFVGLVRALRGERDLLAWMTVAFGVITIVLSQRRSFLLAVVVVGVAVSVVALIERREVVFGVLVSLGAAGVLFFAAGGSVNLVTTGSGPGYNAIHGEIGDQYRISERANVLSNLRKAPLQGLGFGVPWVQVDPLPGYFSGNFNYTHVGFLWVWLKMGVLGLLAYVAMLIYGCACAARAYGRTLVRCRPLVLASAGVIAADVILELTATFVGSDAQYTYVLALAVGIAVAAGDSDVRGWRAVAERYPRRRAEGFA
jgi:hypothetical protein